MRISIYKKFLSLSICCGICYAFTFAGLPKTAIAADLRVGSINSERVLRESKPAKLAENKLKAEFAKRDKELQDAEKHLKLMHDKLERDASNLLDKQRNERQRIIRDLSLDLANKQRAFREDLEQRRNEDLTAVLSIIDAAIRKEAEEGKYSLVIQDPVYANLDADITDRVIKALDRASDHK